jgi:hypothetical protein
MKKAKKPAKPYWEMNLQELREATRDLEGDLPDGMFGPMSLTGKAAWERAKRKRGRPPVGEGSKVISLSVEKTLLKRSDVLAKKEGLTRAQLFARALENLLRKRAG